MRLLDPENRTKFAAVVLLLLLGTAMFFSNRGQNVELAKKVCAVCGVQGDTEKKTVFAQVPFAGEEFAVHSEEHRKEFLKRPDYFSAELHRLNLHH